MLPDDPLGVSEADLLDAEIDALFLPPQPSPKPVREFEPPAIVEGLDSATYHGDTNSVGVGGLSFMRRSPLHYWHAHRRPGRTSEPTTDAQIFGLAVHCLLLEPPKFCERFVERPASIKVRSGRKWEAFAASLNGRNEMKSERMEDARRIARSIRGNALAGELLSGDGSSEASVYWTDQATGVRCRMRPDFAPNERPILVDLKCTGDAGDAAIARTAVNLGWPMRAAWYVDGWRAATGERREYYFAVWEDAEPFAFAAYYLDDDALQMGREQYQVLLGRYAKCLESDEWPGYPNMLQPIILPAWATGAR